MLLNNDRLYDVSFRINSYTAESQAFALLAALPEIKSFIFEYNGITEERFREIEHVLASIGVNMLDMTKEPHIPEKEDVVQEEEKAEEALPEEVKIAALLDELLHRRQIIYDTANSKIEEDKKIKEVEINTRDYQNTVNTLIDSLTNSVAEKLLEKFPDE
jgi:hypothetical protein